MSKGTEMVKVEEKSAALITSGIDEDLLKEAAAEAGAGLEKATADDYALPILKILQGLSPELSRSDASFIAEAHAGDILNPVTGDLFSGQEGVTVIPVHFEKIWIEWRKRESGGGFVAKYDTKDDALAQAEPVNDVIDTANHYVLVRGKDGNWTPAMLSFKNTAMKASRLWISRMSMVKLPGTQLTAPTAMKQYVMTTVEKQNEKGRFYVPSIDVVEGPEGWTPKALYHEAKMFREVVNKGLVKVKYDQNEGEGVGAGAAGDDDDLDEKDTLKGGF